MKVVHRLWIDIEGGTGMPDRYRHYGQEWRRLNPDWVVHDWCLNELPPMRNQKVLDNLRSRTTRGLDEPLAVQMADVIGYDLIWRFGGLYVNCDLQPVRSIEKWLLPRVGDEPYAGLEDPVQVVNAAIGGLTQDPFWNFVVEELPRRYWRMEDGEMNQVTGPHLLTDCVQRWKAEGKRFKVLSVETFNPVHFHQIPMGETADGKFDVNNLHADTVAVHHWGHRLTGRDNWVR